MESDPKDKEAEKPPHFSLIAKGPPATGKSFTLELIKRALKQFSWFKVEQIGPHELKITKDPNINRLKYPVDTC